METPEEINQRYIDSKYKFIGQLIILATLFWVFVQLAGQLSDIRKQKELALQREKSLHLGELGPFSYFMTKLVSAADKACGHDDVCLINWSNVEFPKCVANQGFTDHEIAQMKDIVLRLNLDPLIRETWSEGRGSDVTSVDKSATALKPKQKQPENWARRADLYYAYQLGGNSVRGDVKAEAKFNEKFAGDIEAEAEYKRGVAEKSTKQTPTPDARH